MWGAYFACLALGLFVGQEVSFRIRDTMRRRRDDRATHADSRVQSPWRVAAEHGDETPALRAEVSRLLAENAALREESSRAPTRWTLHVAPPGDFPATEIATFLLVASIAWWSWYFVQDGWTRLVMRFAAVVAVWSIAWALCFVRREKGGAA